MKKSDKTSWGKVADWYDDLIEGNTDNYQKAVILPNLLRIVDPQKNEMILDLACGQGFFAYALSRKGARVIGTDISPELIKLAQQHAPNVDFKVASADNLSFIKTGTIQKISIVLALQNIENVAKVMAECCRILVPQGKLYVVLNHPAFRIPKESSWGWDEKTKTQYRRIDRYISESKVKIQMHPGENPDEFTLSFHRPLQFYFKALEKNGFGVTRLEEWISHKKSEPGPRAEAEDRARKEIPLFLALAAVKLS